MRSKLKFILPLFVLVALGVGFKLALAPAETKPRAKVEGDVYVLPREFLVNLRAGRYARLTVALVLQHQEPAGEKEKEKEGASPEPPEGFGTLPQEALVRSIVTDTLAGEDARRILKTSGRSALEKRMLARVRKTTDVDASALRITDVTVQ